MPKTLPTPRAVSSFTAREIASLLKRARQIFTSPQLSIKAGLKNDIHSRILIITPKKMGTAPLRNLIKRRLKALFYEEKLFNSPFDLVIYCKKGATELPYADLKILLPLILENAQKKGISSSRETVKPHQTTLLDSHLTKNS